MTGVQTCALPISLFELRGQHLQALVAYHAAAADLERLTGTPLVARDAPEGKP